MRILLGVAGGVAAYKSVLLLRLLREAHHAVRVIPTRNALRFVGAATFEALSGEPVAADVFDDVPEVAHVALGRAADLVIVAPATADLIARAAVGRADDLLTATLLTARCPIAFAPAMHTEMWTHPTTVRNVAALRSAGVAIIGPASGRLTGTDSGEGRMAEPDQIAREALALCGPRDLAGLRVVVSAGGTREPLDPVRFLGNRSSGRQGVALARAAAARGAAVCLVAANLEAGVDTAGLDVRVAETAQELGSAVRDAAADADVVVMAAAVADFRPAEQSAAKIKKRSGAAPAPIELVENPDILAELAAHRPTANLTVVGFAAETGDDDGDVLAHGVAKARRKGADLMVVNAVGEGRGFGAVENEVTIVDASGRIVARARGSKREVSDAVWDAIGMHRRR